MKADLMENVGITVLQKEEAIRQKAALVETTKETIAKEGIMEKEETMASAEAKDREEKDADATALLKTNLTDILKGEATALMRDVATESAKALEAGGMKVV